MSRNTPKRPRLLHYIEYAALRLVYALVRAVPLSIGTRISAAIVGWIGPLTSRHRRALDHLKLAMPELTDGEREKIVRGMWRNIGTVIVEALQFDRLARETDRFTHNFNGVDRIIKEAPEGCVFVSCHLANWEILPMALRATHRVPAGVYQKLANPLSDAFLKGVREPYYPGGLFPKSHSTARHLLAVAKGGGDIAVLADLRDLRGVQVPFFGKLAWSTPFPAMIARSFDRPILAACPVRIGPSRFRFDYREIEVPHTEDRDADIAAATANIQACFEDWIREHPDQWLWTHRKWAPRGWKKGPLSRFANELTNAT